MPVLELEHVPSRDELADGIDVPPVPRPYYRGATNFEPGQRVRVGEFFPGTRQIVNGIGVVSGLESRLVSLTGAPVAIVAYLEGANSEVGVLHAGVGNKGGLPNETMRDLAAGPVISSAQEVRNVWTKPSGRAPAPAGVRARAGRR